MKSLIRRLIKFNVRDAMHIEPLIRNMFGDDQSLGTKPCGNFAQQWAAKKLALGLRVKPDCAATLGRRRAMINRGAL
jgi:hypothetical protein